MKRRGCVRYGPWPRSGSRRATVPTSPGRLVTLTLMRRLTAGLALLPAACAAPTSPPPPEVDAAASGALVASLDAQAHEAEARLVRHPIAPPPGIEVAVLERRPASHARSVMPLDEALADASSSFPAPEVETPDTPGADELDEALKLYIRARDELLRGLTLAAVTHLERARTLDPTAASILRELAHAYALAKNNALIAATFQRLIQLEPDDSEALFTLGLAAVNRGDDVRAIARLAHLRLAGHRFDHDPAAEVLADYAMHVAMRRMEYDRAAIELGRAAAEVSFPRDVPTAYRFQLSSLYRQRGQLWLAVGDAYCRLGSYESALEAYERSAALPLSDEAALAGRLVYANLQLGNVRRAGSCLLAAVESAAPDVTDRHVRMCAYFGSSVTDARWVAHALVDLQGEHPDSVGVARAAAVLLPPEEASRHLQAFVRRRPRAVEGVAELLAWLGPDEPQAAIDLTASLAGEEIDLAAAYVRRLLRALPAAAPLIDASEPPRSAGHALVRVRVLEELAALGRAWAECIAALRRWPDDDGLRLMRIELAGRLDEPPLLAEALAAAQDLTSAWSWLVRSAAHRELEDDVAALAAATAACDASDQENEHRMAARLELARVHIERGLVMDIDPARIAVFDQAIDAIKEAQRIAPNREEPYELLTSLLDVGGPLANAADLRQVRNQLRRRVPDARLVARLDAEENLRARRFDQALAQVRALVQTDPTDVASLALAMQAWKIAGRTDEGEAWLRGFLTPPTADTAVLDQLVRFLIGLDRAEVARELLEARLAAAPDGATVDDPAAMRLLEVVCQVAGPAEQARALGEARLLRRPEGTRRALQLAILYARCGDAAAALDQLEWISARAGAATPRHLAGAIGLCSSMEVLPERRDVLTARLVERATRLEPGTPMGVYAAGLLALARDEAARPRFEALVADAARNAKGAGDLSLTGTLSWRDLAQRLIDLGEPGAAATALRTRLDAVLSGPAPEPAALGLLVSMIVTADAASSSDARPTLGLLRDLDARSITPVLPGMDGQPSLAAALAAASQLFGLLGNDEASETLLAEAIRLDPTDAMSLNNLGYQRIEAGRIDDETRGMVERAAVMLPEEASIADTKAWLLYKSGRYEEKDGEPGAVDELRRAIDLVVEPSAEVLDHYGDALWRIGRPGQAAAAWRQAVEILDDADRREQIVRNYRLLQSQVWGLVVSDPAAMYDRDFGTVLERARKKLDAAEGGGTPPVAPTFAELPPTNDRS